MGGIARILRGRDPALPDIRLPATDIADVSAAHLAALDRPDTAGRRFIVADRVLSMPDMARMRQDTFPARHIPIRVAPRPLLRPLALFDAAVRRVLPWIDWQVSLDNRAVRQGLGVAITPARGSVLATGRFRAARR